jgi:hypothetical protein
LNGIGVLFRRGIAGEDWTPSCTAFLKAAVPEKLRSGMSRE